MQEICGAVRLLLAQKETDDFATGSCGETISKMIGFLSDASNLLAGIDESVVREYIDMSKRYNGSHEKIVADMFALSKYEPDALLVSGRLILLDVYQKLPFKSFYESVVHNASLTQHFKDTVVHFRYEIENKLCHSRDLVFNYGAIRAFQRTYMLRHDGVICETPQWVFMRVAIALMVSADSPTEEELSQAFALYDVLSLRLAMLATPILMNAGTHNGQLSSCFLAEIVEDSMDSILSLHKDVGLMSKGGGGIGISVNKIRATGAPIKGTNGTSKGLVPMLKMYETLALYADQGGGRRKGSFAVYIADHHLECEDIVALKGRSGDMTRKCLDLFTAVWLSDLFMSRVRDDLEWTLLCPATYPGLENVYGSEFETLYTLYENMALSRPESFDGVLRHKRVRARELLQKMFAYQVESGSPYIVYKDHVNHKSNQKNVGVIKQSNLCSEIVQVTGKTHNGTEHQAVCNLASLCAGRFVTGNKPAFDAQGFSEMAQFMVLVVNKVIDKTTYPTRQTYESNMHLRPMAIGIQGFADLYQQLRIPYQTDACKSLTAIVYESLQFGAWRASVLLAAQNKPYFFFKGSPASKGLFQHNLWNKPDPDNFSWAALRKDMMRYGVYNSLLTAQMPTATTSQIGGQYESMEPPSTNLFRRDTLSGSYIVLNPYLMRDIKARGLNAERVADHMLSNEGSIAGTDLPEDMKELYKTAYEVGNKNIIDHSIARGPFLDQSSSNNLFFVQDMCAVAPLYSAQMYAWENGVKTGSYYIRVLMDVNTFQTKSISTLRKEASAGKNLLAMNRLRQLVSDCERAGLLPEGSDWKALSSVALTEAAEKLKEVLAASKDDVGSQENLRAKVVELEEELATADEGQEGDIVAKLAAKRAALAELCDDDVCLVCQ